MGEPERLLVYACVAVPLVAAALVFRLTRHEKPDGPGYQYDIRGSRAYLDKLEATCASVNRDYAIGRSPSVPELVARFRAVTPARGYESLHYRLIKALEGAREPEAALEFTSVAALLDAVDCVGAPHSSPQLAYPRAPIADGRTRLSWDDFTAAIDGICADNSNRTVMAGKLIAELDGEENWFGLQMGLRVCSSRGPAFPPGHDTRMG